MSRRKTASHMVRVIMTVIAVLACAAAPAGESIRLEQPWIRMLPGDLPLAGYFELVNASNAPAVLVGAESPEFGGVMMHRSVSEGGTARMEHVDAVEVPAGGSVRFAPGGYHLMLMKRRSALAVGDRVPITLRFADGSHLSADFEVRDASAE